MFSKSSQRKASKGSVQIKTSNDRLQLVFSYGGKRHYLSLGFPDTPQNRKLAEMKAREIELDMLSGHFEGLDKYKPNRSLAVVESTPTLTPKPSLAELWTKFLEFKTPQCSPNTMHLTYRQFTRYLERLPSKDLDQAPQIRDWILINVPLNSAKRFITRLSACCNWAMKSGLIGDNPFDGMATEIKLPKSSRGDGNDIDPFTAQERDAILEALASNRFCPKKSNCKHSHYLPFISFLFFTGCRTSEAMALQWKHISPDFRSISFEQSVIVTESGQALREGLKTQERRRFPCNEKLKQLLLTIKPEGTDPESLIFPGAKGSYLDYRALRKNVWKRVLEGLELEYRNLYQTRHSFVTMALENGLDAKDVARLVGNSPEVIYRHYAGNKRELFVPEF